MKFYPDEEENPEYWWDVELDDVRYEVYSIEKDEDDPYNQYREWKGKLSRENKVEHILKRPDSYVGPVDLNVEPYWVLNSNKSQFEKKNLKYSPALLKIFDEILVNAIDRNSMHPKNVTSISVDIDKESGAVTIENNGPLGGIGVRMHEKEGLWNPELTFGHLLTSTNYDDSQKSVCWADVMVMEPS